MMTTRDTRAELHREIVACQADIWLCKRRMAKHRPDYYIVKNLLEHNKETLEWLECRAGDE